MRHWFYLLLLESVISVDLKLTPSSDDNQRRDLRNSRQTHIISKGLFSTSTSIAWNLNHVGSSVNTDRHHENRSLGMLQLQQQMMYISVFDFHQHVAPVIGVYIANQQWLHVVSTLSRLVYVDGTYTSPNSSDVSVGNWRDWLNCFRPMEVYLIPGEIENLGFFTKLLA